MTLQSSGRITLKDIRREFYSSTPGADDITNYYRGGGLVPDIPENINIPTTGEVHWTDYYGAKNVLPGNNVIYAGGSPQTNVIQKFNISTRGTATLFGYITTYANGKRYATGIANGSNNKAVISGWTRSSGKPQSHYEYIKTDVLTITTPANSTYFGNMRYSVSFCGGMSNGTSNRGLFCGGNHGSVPNYDRNYIQYFTISTPSNGTTFGTLTTGAVAPGGVDNGENNRGVRIGGHKYTDYGTSPGQNLISNRNIIDYVTINSTGNATDFGDMTHASGKNMAACSNKTLDRGVFTYLGSSTGAYNSEIDYITMTTPGNSTTFGNLSAYRNGIGQSCSNGVGNTGVFPGGQSFGTSTETNLIEFYNPITGAGAILTGRLSRPLSFGACVSNA